MKPTEQKTMLDFLNEVSIEEGHTGWRMVYDQHNYFDCNYIPQEAGRRYANWAISQMQPEWVSVTDRLPETLQSVICELKNGAVFQLTYGRLTGFFDPVYGKPVSDNNPVVQWTRLPQPPTK